MFQSSPTVKHASLVSSDVWYLKYPKFRTGTWFLVPPITNTDVPLPTSHTGPIPHIFGEIPTTFLAIQSSTKNISALAVTGAVDVLPRPVVLNITTCLLVK